MAEDMMPADFGGLSPGALPQQMNALRALAAQISDIEAAEISSGQPPGEASAGPVLDAGQTPEQEVQHKQQSEQQASASSDTTCETPAVGALVTPPLKEAEIVTSDRRRGAAQQCPHVPAPDATEKPVSSSPDNSTLGSSDNSAGMSHTPGHDLVSRGELARSSETKSERQGTTMDNEIVWHERDHAHNNESASMEAKTVERAQPSVPATAHASLSSGEKVSSATIAAAIMHHRQLTGRYVEIIDEEIVAASLPNPCATIVVPTAPATTKLSSQRGSLEADNDEPETSALQAARATYAASLSKHSSRATLSSECSRRQMTMEGASDEEDCDLAFLSSGSSDDYSCEDGSNMFDDFDRNNALGGGKWIWQAADDGDGSMAGGDRHCGSSGLAGEEQEQQWKRHYGGDDVGADGNGKQGTAGDNHRRRHSRHPEDAAKQRDRHLPAKGEDHDHDHLQQRRQHQHRRTRTRRDREIKAATAASAAAALIAPALTPVELRDALPPRPTCGTTTRSRSLRGAAEDAPGGAPAEVSSSGGGGICSRDRDSKRGGHKLGDESDFRSRGKGNPKLFGGSGRIKSSPRVASASMRRTETMPSAGASASDFVADALRAVGVPQRPHRFLRRRGERKTGKKADGASRSISGSTSSTSSSRSGRQPSGAVFAASTSGPHGDVDSSSLGNGEHKRTGNTNDGIGSGGDTKLNATSEDTGVFVNPLGLQQNRGFASASISVARASFNGGHPLGMKGDTRASRGALIADENDVSIPLGQPAGVSAEETGKGRRKSLDVWTSTGSHSKSRRDLSGTRDTDRSFSEFSLRRGSGDLSTSWKGTGRSESCKEIKGKHFTPGRVRRRRSMLGAMKKGVGKVWNRVVADHPAPLPIDENLTKDEQRVVHAKRERERWVGNWQHNSMAEQHHNYVLDVHRQGSG